MKGMLPSPKQRNKAEQRQRKHKKQHKTGECNHTHHIFQPSTLLYCLIRTLKLLCLGQPATTDEGIIID